MFLYFNFFLIKTTRKDFSQHESVKLATAVGHLKITDAFGVWATKITIY